MAIIYMANMTLIAGLMGACVISQGTSLIIFGVEQVKT
jgi:hypothetical protein